MPQDGPRQRIPVKAHTRKAPTRAPKPRPAGQTRTEAAPDTSKSRRVAKQLAPRGHAPTVFQEPAGLRSPTERMQDKQDRKTARVILKAAGASPKRGLSRQEVHAVLNHPAVKDLVKSVQPYLAKPKPHQSVFKKALGVAKHVGLAAEPEVGLIKKVAGVRKPDDLTKLAGVTPYADAAIPKVVRTKVGKPLDKEVQKGLAALVKLSDKGGAAATGGKLQAEGVGSGGLKPNVKKFLTNLGKDAVSFPANTLLSGYLTVAHPDQVLKGTIDQLKHPGKTAFEHPISTAALLRGGEAGLSRAAGDVLRAAPKGSALHEYASTERVPLKLTGNAAVQRRASKGLLENRVQRAVDRRAVRKGRETTVNVHLHDERGTILKKPAIQATERQMLKPGFGRPQAGFLKRRVDQVVGTNAGMKTNRRVQVLNAMLHGRSLLDRARGKSTAQQALRAAGHEDAVPLILEGILREGHVIDAAQHGHLHEALLAERQRITDAMVKLDPQANAADLTNARENVARIDHLLNDQSFLDNPADAFKAAEDFVKVHGNSITSAGLEAERAKHGDFTLEQAQRRVLLPFAEREMGLKWNQTHGRFEVEHTVTASPERLQQLADLRDSYRANAARQHESGQYRFGRANAVHMDRAAESVDRELEALKSGHLKVGAPVSTEAIMREFQARGGNLEHLGYVHRFESIDNPKSYRGGGSMLAHPGATKTYTGSGTHGALYHRSYTALAEQMAHAATRVEHHYGVNELVNQFGHSRPDGNPYWDQASADAEIKNLRDRGEGDYVKVVAARQTAPQSLLEQYHPAELADSFHAPENEQQHVVLMRKEVVDQINKHENLRNTVAPEVQTASQYFRHAVLPTSSKWFAGNSIEALLRSAINDPTLARSMLRGRKLQGALAEQGHPGEEFAPQNGARQLERLQVMASAGLFRSQKFADFYRPEQQNSDFMRAMHALRQKAGPRQIGNAWDAYRNKVVAWNEKAESSVYWSALGKEAQREIQSVTGSWAQTISIGKEAYQEVARGMLDPNALARYADAVDKMRGRYSNLSPRARYYVTQYLPFAPWYVNAIHFLAVTLPAHHPVLTGAAAGMYLGSEKQRNAQHLPPWGIGSIHGIDVNHFTPAGMAKGTVAETLKGATDLVMPATSGIIHNLNGEAWTGQKFPAGTSTILMALNTGLETFIPGSSKVQTVLQHGGTATPDSTLWHPKTKPGTATNLAAGFKKALYPFGKQRLSAAPVNGLPVLDSAAAGAKLPKLDSAGASSALPTLDSAK